MHNIPFFVIQWRLCLDEIFDNLCMAIAWCQYQSTRSILKCESKHGIISYHYLCLSIRTFLVTYIQQFIIIKTWCTIYHHQDFMHNIPFFVNPVTHLLGWDIWQSLYGHRLMPISKHSIHPEMWIQTWNYSCHYLYLNKRTFLVTYIQ